MVGDVLRILRGAKLRIASERGDPTAAPSSGSTRVPDTVASVEVPRPRNRKRPAVGMAGSRDEQKPRLPDAGETIGSSGTRGTFKKKDRAAPKNEPTSTDRLASDGPRSTVLERLGNGSTDRKVSSGIMARLGSCSDEATVPHARIGSTNDENESAEDDDGDANGHSEREYSGGGDYSMDQWQPRSSVLSRLGGGTYTSGDKPRITLDQDAARCVCK